jgi:hypothetical protein
MASFVVSFEPPLPDAAAITVPPDLDWPTVYRLSQGLEWHYVTYAIADQLFSYDRTDLSQVLADLLGALDELDSGFEGSLIMSGYPVVGVTRHDELLIFYDLGNAAGWSVQIDLAEVQEALTTAASRVWGCISSPNKAP